MPVCLSKLGELILASGAGGWAVLTSEGVPIIHQNQDQWIWSIKAGLDNTIVSNPQATALRMIQSFYSTYIYLICRCMDAKMEIYLITKYCLVLFTGCITTDMLTGNI